LDGQMSNQVSHSSSNWGLALLTSCRARSFRLFKISVWDTWPSSRRRTG